MTTDANPDSPNEWNVIQVGGINPEYQMIQSDRIEPDQSEYSDSTKQGTSELYASVPGNSDAPPLPVPRRTKINPCYEPSANTFTHPTILSNHNQLSPPIDVDMEIEQDYNSKKCTLLITLTVLIGIGILLTMLAVIFAILMMFGVIELRCRSTQLSNNCSCSEESSRLLLSRLQNQTRDLTEKIGLLNATIADANKLAATDYESLNNRANSLSISLDSTNRSCHSKINSILELENATVLANMSNVEVFSKCVAEYLSNCTIHLNETLCQTSLHPLEVQGYDNTNIACHVSSYPSNTTSLYAANNNVIILDNTVRCFCSTRQIQGNRTAVINCLLFRKRCPVNQDIGVPIIIN